MKKQSLIKGVIVLTISALITRILGFANSIILSRILGPEGIGLIMMVMPLIGLLMTLTTLGLPVAISKSVAEADNQNNPQKIKRILVISLTITGSLSILLSFITLNLADTFTSFLADQRSYYSLIALIPIIPILAFSGVLKGYFRGKQNMNPIAISQIIEQICRIILIYFFVTWLFPYGIGIAAAGAIIASVIGEGFSLMYLVIVFKISTKYRYPHRRIIKPLLKDKNTLFDLLHTGLPTTGNGFIRSIIRAVQPIIITQSLIRIGMNPSMITEQYGMLTGFVMPLLFLPGFINHSLGISLVPAISEAKSQNNKKLVRHRVYQATRISLLVGVPSTAILYIFSEELLSIIYQAPEATGMLKLMAPFFLFQYFHSPLQSTLIGLGHATLAMINNIIPKFVGLILIYPLANHFQLGIYGVVLAFCVGVILETFLHFVSLVKAIGFSFHLIEMSKIILAGIFMGYSGQLIFSTLVFNNFESIFAFSIALSFSVMVYLVIIVLSGVFQPSEIKRFRHL